MKRSALVLIFLGISLMVSSQSLFDSVFNKYAGNPNFTSLSINPQLFKLIAFFDDEGNDAELDRLAEKLSGLKILISESQNAGFSNEIHELIGKENYQNLMEVVEKGKRVNFYAKEQDGQIYSFVMHAIDEGEEVLLYITGNFSAKDLSQMGSVNCLGNESEHIALLRKLEAGSN